MVTQRLNSLVKVRGINGRLLIETEFIYKKTIKRLNQFLSYFYFSITFLDSIKSDVGS